MTVEIHFEQAHEHKVQVSRVTRGTGVRKHFTRGEAYCRCGWNTPTLLVQSELDALVREHLGASGPAVSA